MTPKIDTEYTIEVIGEVQDTYEHEGQTYVSVSFQGGMGIYLELADGAAPPEAGDTVRLIGHRLQGVLRPSVGGAGGGGPRTLRPALRKHLRNVGPPRQRLP